MSEAIAFLVGILTNMAYSLLVSVGKSIVQRTRDYFEPILRVRLDAEGNTATFQASKTVYCRIHEKLRDSFEEVEAWIREQVETQYWEEIYLVAHRFGRIKGVLYASVYQKCGSTK